jgi:energy-converting hydrogenase A subunit R
MGRQLDTDCEGPLSKNDNAQELSARFIPRGEAFFAVVSRYDDYLADVVKKPGYKAGDTLKLILPFLIAFGVTNEAIRSYSRSHVLLLPGAAETLRFLLERMPCFIISTSYEPYIQALCEVVGFPMDQVFCTRLDADRYSVKPDENAWIRDAAREITEMKLLEWPEKARGMADLSEIHRETVRRLDRIFWKAIHRMEIGRIFDEVNPIGGRGKANAVLESLKMTGNGPADVMYVGDSITDVQALELARDQGGLAISFNGNGYAVRSSQICCLSRDARVIALLADVFNKEGREAVLKLASSWGKDSLRRFPIDPALEGWLDRFPEKDFPRIVTISDSNRKEVILESEAFRKSVRGVEIGALG